MSAGAEFARKGVGKTLKVSNTSLGHLASYARIAIQMGKISREQENWRGARAIKLRIAGKLR
jgi:hypothetical protein